jgi:hypothetical protein
MRSPHLLVMALDWNLYAQIGTAIAGAVAMLGVPFAAWQYLRAARTRKAEWLTSLHGKFYEGEQYSEIRNLLDYGGPHLQRLVPSVVEGTDDALADAFYRYLNFFELLASLRELGQIERKEVLWLFEYDLRKLSEYPFVLEALAREGFERLPRLLNELNLPANDGHTTLRLRNAEAARRTEPQPPSPGTPGGTSFHDGPSV